ncbi:MAG: hypothetical protein HRT64_03705, partial [Erythrobacter sp.]|nr:hypothetical protein [Erythrobacter sp.]
MSRIETCQIAALFVGICSVAHDRPMANTRSLQRHRNAQGLVRMKRQKLKETSFLGAALAMSVVGIEMPAHAAEMPTPKGGIAMNDFGELEAFGSLASLHDVAQKSKSKSKKGSKKSSKKGSVGSSSGGDYYGTSSG